MNSEKPLLYPPHLTLRMQALEYNLPEILLLSLDWKNLLYKIGTAQKE